MDSGEKFHRPGGVGEGEKVGEWKRGGTGTYRMNYGRGQGRYCQKSRRGSPAGVAVLGREIWGRGRKKVTSRDADRRVPPVSGWEGKKKKARGCAGLRGLGGCFVGWGFAGLAQVSAARLRSLFF